MKKKRLHIYKKWGEERERDGRGRMGTLQYMILNKSVLVQQCQVSGTKTAEVKHHQSLHNNYETMELYQPVKGKCVSLADLFNLNHRFFN